MRIPFEFSSPWLGLLFAGAVKATVLLVLAWIATASMRRAPAAARHLVWTLALVGAMGLPLASLLIPAWPLHWMPTLIAGDANPTPTTNSLVLHDAAREPRDVSIIEQPTEPKSVTSAATTTTNLSVEQPPTDTAPARTAPTLPQLDARTLLRVLPLVWLVGAALLLTRRAVAAIRVGRLARRSAALADPAWHAALDHHARALGVTRVPTLRISADADVPMTFGTLRPVILVPADAGSWTRARRDFVLLHELGHIRRRDTLTQLAGQLAAAIYWFHPLVWVAKRRQRAEAEHACDDQVLDSGALASAYARELLELATAARPHDTYGAAALAMARRSQLEGRLLTILDPRNTRGAVGRRFVLGALVFTVAATAAIAAARPARVEERDAKPVLSAASSIVTSAAPVRCPILVAEPTSDPSAAATAAVVTGPDASLALADEPAPAADSNPVVSSVSTSVSASTGGGEADDGSGELATAVSSAVLAAASKSALSSGKSHSSFSIHENDGDLETVNGNWIDDDGRDAKYKSKGVVRFNDALDDVVSIGGGGYLTVEEENDGHRWRAEFKPQGGSVQRTYWVDGDRAEWNAAAREWFAGFLIATDRHSAMLAKQRYPKLMAQGGATAVLDELAKMPSDYAQSVYYRMLLEDGISKEDMRRAVTQAGRDVKSDYELARILASASSQGALQDPATRTAYLKAIDGIESDYEHARVLMIVLERPKLDPALASEALQSVASISSDYERSRILVTMSEKGSVAPAIQREYIRTANGIKSDYEKSRSLRSLVQNAEIGDDNVAPLLAATSSIRSDYEKANVLVGIAESVQLDKTGRAAFVETAQSIRSDYERKRALSAVGEKSASY